jgi:hypothetical protein
MTEPSSPTSNIERVANEDVPDVGAALTALLEAKNADGSPRWSLKDFHATFPPMMHDARLVDAGHRLAGQSGADLAARAPKLGEKALEGAISGANLARQMQKKIPLR